MCFESFIKHGFGFTPAISLYVTCGTEQEVDAVYAQLAACGEVDMPLDRYSFSPRYAWVSDRLGVSWQATVAGRGWVGSHRFLPGYPPEAFSGLTAV